MLARLCAEIDRAARPKFQAGNTGQDEAKPEPEHQFQLVALPLSIAFARLSNSSITPEFLRCRCPALMMQRWRAPRGRANVSVPAIYKGNTSIGKIDDVLADLDHGAVSAVVLSVGGFLGIGDKLVAVPSNQIKVSPEAKFTDLTKDQLSNAPAFDPAKKTR